MFYLAQASKVRSYTVVRSARNLGTRRGWDPQGYRTQYWAAWGSEGESYGARLIAPRGMALSKLVNLCKSVSSSISGSKKLLREESQYRTKVWKEVVPWEARPASSALLWAALLRSLAAVSSQTSLMWWDGRGDRTRVCAHAPEVQQHIKSLLVYTFLPLNYLLSSSCGSPGLAPPHCFRNGAPGSGKLITLGLVGAQWCNLKARL